MRTKLMLTVLGIAVATGVPAGGAAASGPAPPGKEPVDQTCDGIGTVPITLTRGDSFGAAQFVDAKGHAIPVVVTVTVTDVTTGTVIDSQSFAVGGGHAHSNEATTHCSGVRFEGLASDFFGTDLPPGVAAEDTIQSSFDADVIIKL
jgi:hypothetical protein